MKKFGLILFILLFLTIAIFSSQNNNNFSNNKVYSSLLAFCLLKLDSIIMVFFYSGIVFLIISIFIFVCEICGCGCGLPKNFHPMAWAKILFCSGVILLLLSRLTPSSGEALIVIRNLNILDANTYNYICQMTFNEGLMFGF